MTFLIGRFEKLPNGFNLRDFFYNLLIPFFYQQSYFEANNIWPWGEYAHGILGLFEWYSKIGAITKTDLQVFINRLSQYPQWESIKIKLTQKEGIKGHHNCICGSSKRLRDCHPNVWRGLWKLNQDIIKFDVL